jgi:hypothetical protein
MLFFRTKYINAKETKISGMDASMWTICLESIRNLELKVKPKRITIMINMQVRMKPTL